MCVFFSSKSSGSLQLIFISRNLNRGHYIDQEIINQDKRYGRSILLMRVPLAQMMVLIFIFFIYDKKI